ncbi:alpha/beta hydrolase-fold protein [uncultured Lutibacter sp.]|uniref:alpha/beta hydrolase n=1 Tax=uncultured Lutibacter sp. TaxID=437739 RepID=UPI0026373B98|nr:alpha/beta hydrolase-fold protein [uncultured Lutibacter sp.]
MKKSKIKNSIAIIITVVTCWNLNSQSITTKKFNSSELLTERYIKIYVPPSYEIDSTKLYPVTIVLDAEYLFDVFVGNAILFAAKDKAPEQIIIGINQNRYNERYEDCSYSKENSYPTQEGEAFYRFIRGELIDYVEENYRTSQFKTIVGNTLTANFINYFLIEDFPGFNAFISINPYLAIDMPTMLQHKIPSIKDENIYYYLSNGKYNSEKYRNSISATNELLATTNNGKFKYQYETFDTSTKTASIGQSISGALAFIFEMYSSISKEEFENNIQNLSPADAIAYLENKYVEIEYLFGSNLKIRERDIFAIESIILDKENGDYLKSFGEMINRLYNDSPIGDYYIGRYYETGGKFKQALKYYKNGYMKLPEGDPNADGYYKNIERVLSKRDGTYIEPNKQ